jgi:hypothetical protein
LRLQCITRRELGAFVSVRGSTLCGKSSVDADALIASRAQLLLHAGTFYVTVRAAWTQVESVAVEMVPGYGPVSRETDSIVSAPSRRRSRTKASHLKVA